MWSAQTKTQNMNLAESDLRINEDIMYALEAARRHRLAACFQKTKTITELCVGRFLLQYSHICRIAGVKLNTEAPKKSVILKNFLIVVQPNVTQFRSVCFSSHVKDGSKLFCHSTVH